MLLVCCMQTASPEAPKKEKDEFAPMYNVKWQEVDPGEVRGTGADVRQGHVMTRHQHSTTPTPPLLISTSTSHPACYQSLHSCHQHTTQVCAGTTRDCMP
jgi:hypothetical protein